MLHIANHVVIPCADIDIRAMRSQGAGGQNVNKVASAVHLRFDVQASSLPDLYKQRLLALHDQRLTTRGVIVIKAQRFRSFEKNRDDALARLAALIRSAIAVRKKRRPTRPTAASRERRLEGKSRRGALKKERGTTSDW